MSHAIADKKPLLTRVRRIRGQADALERALESDADCAAILQQVAAVRGAVNGLMAQMLEGHLRDHLVEGSITPAERERDLDAVLSVIRSYLK